MTAKELSIFLEELLGYKDLREVENSFIADITKLTDSEEKNWHVEGKTIWRAKAWREDLANKAKRMEADRMYKEALDKRKAFLELVTVGVQTSLGVDKELAFPLALKFIKAGNVKAIKLLGIEFEGDIPEIPKKHQVFDNGKLIYEF